MKPAPLVAFADVYYLAVAAHIWLLQQPGLSRLRAPAARCAGLAAYHLSFDKRRRVEGSLSLWRPGSAGRFMRQGIARGVFAATWRELTSWASVPFDTAADGAAEIRGLHHLRAALAAGRGAILWENTGFGERLAAKGILRANGIAVHQVHGPNNLGGLLVRGRASRLARTVIRRFYDRLECRMVAGLIYLSDEGSLAAVRKLTRVLHNNGVVCMSADGRIGRRFVSVDLLGGSAVVATGATSLARLAGAALLPMFCFREKGRVVLTIEAGLDVGDARSESGGSRIAGQYAALMAHYVDRHPEQFRNWHLVHEAPDAAGAGSGGATATIGGAKRGGR